MSAKFDPQASLAALRRQYGEHGGVNASIESSTTFTVMRAETLGAIFEGAKNPDNGACYLYGRSFNPTVRYLGQQLAALEGMEAGYTCSSGMAAISAVLLQLCNTGDHIVCSNTVYGGTFALLKSFFPTKCGVTTTFVDITNLDEVAAAVTNRTRALYVEAISNPTLVVADLPQLAGIAHAHGLQFVVDNTFSPMVLSPARWGADIVVHSLTKFISGASDIVAGAVLGSTAFIKSLMDLHLGAVMLLGPTMDPKVASELSLRLPHLGLRMAEHSRRALAFAERLQLAGGEVSYPGLPSHPQHALLQRLANPGYGLGGLLTLDLGSQRAAERFLERAQNKHGFGLIAVSLGYAETLLSVSGASTSSELSPHERAAAGISSGLVRMSVGITGTLEARWAQLEEAFRAIARPAEPAFRAAQVVRDVAGGLVRVASWDSAGSEGLGMDDALGATARPAAAAGASDSGDEAALRVKIRRVGAKEIVYSRLAPQAGWAKEVEDSRLAPDHVTCQLNDIPGGFGKASTRAHVKGGHWCMDVSGGAAAAAWPQLGPRLAPHALRKGTPLGGSPVATACDAATGWPASSFSTDLVSNGVVEWQVPPTSSSSTLHDAHSSSDELYDRGAADAGMPAHAPPPGLVMDPTSALAPPATASGFASESGAGAGGAQTMQMGGGLAGASEAAEYSSEAGSLSARGYGSTDRLDQLASVSMPLAGPLGASASANGLVGSGGQLGGLGAPLQGGAMSGGATQGGQVGGAGVGAGEALGGRRRADGRQRSAGGEEDIFSAVGGLELDAELRGGAHAQGGEGGVPRVGSHGALAQPQAELPPEEAPTRSLLVSRVDPNHSAEQLKQLFSGWGELRTLYMGDNGTIVIGYHDIRAAMMAHHTLRKENMDIRYATARDGVGGREGEGIVSLFNVSDAISDAEVMLRLRSQYGEVCSVKPHPHMRGCRLVEFYDLRVAAAVLASLDGAASKVPTISELPQQLGTSQLPTGLRNVQSSHVLYSHGGGGNGGPGPAPAGSSSGELDWPQQPRAHSYDNALTPEAMAAMMSAAGGGGGGGVSGAYDAQALALLSAQAGGSSAALAALGDQLARAGYGGSSNALQLQALLASRDGSSASLSSLGLAGGSHPNLASAGSLGLPRGGGGGRGSPGRTPSSASLGSGAGLLGADSQHLSTSQLLAVQGALRNPGSYSDASPAGGGGPGGGLPRRPASMSTGNLMDLYESTAVDRGGAGSGMAGLRGVASSSNLWDQQLQSAASSPAAGGMWSGDGSGWGAAFAPGANEASLRAQAALALGVGADGVPQASIGYLGQGAGAGQAAASAQQYLHQQLLGNLTPQQSVALLAKHGLAGPGGMRGVAGMAGRGKAGREDGALGAGGRLSRRASDPAAEAERRAAQDKVFALDLDRVSNNEDRRTTLMIKNIPNKYTQKMLLSTMDEQFKGAYDFFYLPIDFKNKCNVGYAFINMVDPRYIIPLVQRFNHKKWEKFNSEKVCHISYARIQGKNALVTHFQNSSLMHEDKRCRPILFHIDGPLAGDQEAFPVGPNVRSRPARAAAPGMLGAAMGGPLGGAGMHHAMGGPQPPPLGQPQRGLGP
ncbi:hypothetical protein WJX81_001329 [Elliptochloris bilobata]|uniref:Mei2-like C-terminal RNA recognition motif domain-containing protein n=1 Tax=Elliptochloris bilobata TaxID=381761 RepID=A0AAW1QKC5_9CHLO